VEQEEPKCLKKQNLVKKEINIERTEEALSTGAKIVATGCPFCNTMITDGVKNKEQEAEVKVMDLAELVAQAADI
jgi:Fe-S oxidoreductase